MKVQQYTPNSVVFPYEKAGIIIAGHITVRNHAQVFDKGELIGKYSTGDIIGYIEGDRGITNHPDTWITALN